MEKITIQSIKSSVRKGTTIPGDYIVNDNGDPNVPLIWIGRAELQNWFTRQERPIPPISVLKGAVLTVDTHVITQEMIDAAIARGDKATDRNGAIKAGHLITILGRPVAFNKPGTKRVLLDMNLANCDFSEAKINEMKFDTAIYERQAAVSKSSAELNRLRASAVPAQAVNRAMPATEHVIPTDGSQAPAAPTIGDAPASTEPIKEEPLEHVKLEEA